MLIPPPNEKGEPSIKLASDAYNLDYVQKQLDANFSKDAPYAGRDYVPMIYTHGNVQFGGLGHNHTLGIGLSTPSDGLYKALLSVNGNCLGVNDGACFSGAGVVSFNEAMRQTADKHKHPVEFNASARFNKTAMQVDCKNMIDDLKVRLSAGETITPATVRAAYLKALECDIPTVSKVFDPNKLDQQWRVEYDDLDTKLAQLYKDFHEHPEKLPPQSAFQALTDAHVLTTERYDEIKFALKEFGSVSEFTDALRRLHAYGEALALADAHYTTQGNNQSVDQFRFVSENSEYMFGDNTWRAQLIGDHDKQVEAYKIAAKASPMACFENNEVWQVGLSEKESHEILAIAARSSAKDYQRAFLDGVPKWKSAVSDKERFELFKQVVEIAPNNTISYNYNWSDALSEQQVKEITSRAAHLQVERRQPEDSLMDYNKWAHAMPPEESHKLLLEAATQAAKDKAPHIPESLEIWQSELTDAEKKPIMIVTAQGLAKDYPAACFIYMDKWEKYASPEEKKAILLDALAGARNIDPASVFKYEATWKDLVSSEDRKVILEEAAVKTSVSSPGECMQHIALWKPEVAPIASEVIIKRAASSAATTWPNLCFENMDKWQGEVSEQEKKEILTAAVRKMANNEYKTSSIFENIGKWKDSVDKKDTFECLKKDAHHDPRNCLDKASQWKDMVTPEQQMELLRIAVQERPSNCFLYKHEWSPHVTEEQKKELMQLALKAAVEKDPDYFLSHQDMWGDIVTSEQRSQLLGQFANSAASICPSACYNSMSEWKDTMPLHEANAIITKAANTQARLAPHEFFKDAFLWMSSTSPEDKADMIATAAARAPMEAAKFMAQWKECLSEKEIEALHKLPLPVYVAPPAPEPSKYGEDPFKDIHPVIPKTKAPSEDPFKLSSPKKETSMSTVPAEFKVAMSQYLDSAHTPKTENDKKTPGNLPQLGQGADISRLS